MRLKWTVFVLIACLLSAVLGGIIGAFFLRPITVGEYFTLYQVGETTWKQIEDYRSKFGTYPDSLDSMLREGFLQYEKKFLFETKFGYPVFSYRSNELVLYHQPGTFGGITVWPHSQEDKVIHVRIAR
jgi:ABC-type dipeptide/oligopeptide/nickel transport system permease component